MLTCHSLPTHVHPYAFAYTHIVFTVICTYSYALSGSSIVKGHLLENLSLQIAASVKTRPSADVVHIKAPIINASQYWLSYQLAFAYSKYAWSPLARICEQQASKECATPLPKTAASKQSHAAPLIRSRRRGLPDIQLRWVGWFSRTFTAM